MRKEFQNLKQTLNCHAELNHNCNHAKYPYMSADL